MLAAMPRRKRVSTGGFVYHVLNRAVARQRIFRKQADYLAFEQVL
jgi:putative transposase